MAWRFLTYDMKTFQPTSELPEVADPSKVARVDRPQGTLIDMPTQRGRYYTLKSI